MNGGDNGHSHEYKGVNGQALQVHAVDKNLYTQSISDTVSHAHYAWMCNEKSIITIDSIKLCQKKYHSFVADGIVTRAAHS